VIRLVGWYLSQGEANHAVDILRKAIVAQPDDIALLNTLAGILATSKDDAVRVGSEAVTLAERASKLTGGSHPEVLRTLATAYAATGDFDKAVAVSDNAIAFARAAGRTRFVEQIETDRSAFVNKQPIRSDKY